MIHVHHKAPFKKYLLLSILYLVSFINCFSQSSSDKFKKLEINGTAFNQTVNTIYEDGIGFLWIGSRSGLYRYDGNELKHFQLNVFDANSLPNNNINSIVEDEFQNLWIGSESYIIHYNRKEDKFYGFYKNRYCTIFKKDSHGNVWGAINGVGIVKIVPSEQAEQPLFITDFKYIENSNPITVNIQNLDLVEDEFNRIWFGSASGIGVLNATGEFISTDFKTPVKGLKLLNNNRFLALSSDAILVLGYDKSSTKLEILERYSNAQIGKSHLQTITLDSSNNQLWVGTDKGLYRATRKNNQYVFDDAPQGINYLNKPVRSTLFDSFGNLWVGTLNGVHKYVGGTSIFENSKIQTAKKQNLLSKSLLFLGDHTLLIGRPDGLFNYDIEKKQFTQLNVNLSNVDLIAQNYEKNKLLFADKTILYESSIYNPSNTSLQIREIARFDRVIKDVVAVGNDELWVGLWGRGIKIINNDRPLSDFKKKVVSLLNNLHVSTMLLTENMELWVGTRGQGLFKIDINQEFIEEFKPKKENGISSNAILSLYQDNKNNIWIGTRGGGLNKYDNTNKSFKVYSEKDGLNSNVISAIEADDVGNLWLFTQEGITRFNDKEEKFISFGVEEEIIEVVSEFNVSASSDNNKVLFFGCIDGFNTVYTDQFIQNNKLPSTVITKFQILGATENGSNASSPDSPYKEVNIFSNEEIILPYTSNSITINFSSLDLTSPKNNKYAYTLEGMNHGWIYTNASNRNANFNDLPPGKYTFKVKSSNSDGVWNETPTEVKFQIKPPIWASQWALVIYVLLFLILLTVSILLIRRWYALKQNLVKETISREKDKEHHQMKMTFFTDISHELRTPLSLILGSMEKVVKNNDLKLDTSSSQRIYSNTLRMKRLINQIMDLRKFEEGRLILNISKNDIIEDIKIIKDAFNDFAKNNHIKYEFQSNHARLNAWYDVDILEKILFNLLSNAFKYTPENGAITVAVELDDRDGNQSEATDLEKGTYIKCSVLDTGIGIPKSDLPFIFDRYYQSKKTYENQIPGTGIGMELVQKLVERHQGTIEVDSIENEYTKFTFYLPIKKSRFKKSEIVNKDTPLKRNFIKNSEYQVIEKIVHEGHNTKEIRRSGRPKILLVEDNLDLRQMLKDDLQGEFEVIEASNGSEGYEVALAEKPELIVSDILMPVEDGVSMLKRMKANDLLKNIPVFMLTAKNSEKDKISCLQLGAEDFIEKPFSLEFVKWKIKNVLLRTNKLKEKYTKVITANPIDKEIVSNDEKFIRKLISNIEQHMGDEFLSVEFLASEIGMSRAHLYRKIKAITDDTPVNFIKNIRLKRAAQLLKKNSMYISEIAYVTGFNNQKYFGKCFRKEFNMSPTEYIKKYAEQEEVLD
jgi:signal transduction histidine kinase/ligand-binding sensor domain-containing protein/DNA-binding response OmpR family regulator